MNCEQAVKIPIQKILESFSLFPSKKNSKTAFYFALDREEKIPSLLVDFFKNTAFDFGSGKKFDNVTIVQLLKNCSVSEALEYLSDFEIREKISSENELKNESLYEILDIKTVEHPALIQYLNERKVINQKHLLCEIHYKINSKKYFGIGFKNNSDGYEIRNKYSKICLGKKDVTHFKNSSKNLKIFEGFFDFLSFLEVFSKYDFSESDHLILNSTSMNYKIEKKHINLGKYIQIELYFDNDSAGDKATEILKSKYNCEDKRQLYKNFSDLNDYLCK